MSSRNTKLFISGLSSGVQQKDVFDLFSRHGKVLGCSVKSNYAFVEFSHPDDADDAIRGLDGYTYHGKKLLVQLAVPKGKQNSPARDPLSPFSRTRIYVGGLTEGINIRELEEVFSEVGHVVRTVDKKSFAFLEYESSLHAEKAIKRFNGTDFAGRRLIVNFATIPFHHGGRGAHHSPRRGRSRSLSRSPSRGRKRMRYSSLSRSRSRSPSRSPGRYSRSRSRSRDRGWDHGRDRGRGGDRRRGRSRSPGGRDYSPYVRRSWSRSSGSSSGSDSSRSRSRSRTRSRTPSKSPSSSSSLNSPSTRPANGATKTPATTDVPPPPPSTTPPAPPDASASTPPDTTPPPPPQPIVTSPPTSEAAPSPQSPPVDTPKQPEDSSTTPTPTPTPSLSTPVSPPSIPSSDSSPKPTQEPFPTDATVKTEPMQESFASAGTPPLPIHSSQEPQKWEPLIPPSYPPKSAILGHYPATQSPAHLSALLPTPSYISPHVPIIPPALPTTQPTLVTTPPLMPITPPATSPSLTSSAEIEQRPANFDTPTPSTTTTSIPTSTPAPAPAPAPTPTHSAPASAPAPTSTPTPTPSKETDKEKEKEKEREPTTTKEIDNKDKDKDKDRERDRDSRDYRDRDYRDNRDRDTRDNRDNYRDNRDRDRDSRDYGRRRYNDRRGDYAPTTSSSSYHDTYSKKTTERDTSTGDAEDGTMKDETARASGDSSAASAGSSALSVSATSSKDLEQVLSNLFKTRDAMLKGIDGVFAELQRRNQLFTQLISREEGRNKEIDGLRAELINVKKDLVTKNEMGCRRIESELERRLNLLERKLSKTPQEEEASRKATQDSLIQALAVAITPITGSIETTFKLLVDTRNEQQALKGELRLVLDALRADVHGSREAVMGKVDLAMSDLRGPLGQLAANEAQNARQIDAMRGQIAALREQVAGVAQTQAQQPAPAPAPAQPQEPAPFAGAFGKKMFPIEGITSKIFSIDQKIETLETNLSKQFADLKNEILTQQAIKGMISEDKKNAARNTRKKGVM